MPNDIWWSSCTGTFINLFQPRWQTTRNHDRKVHHGLRELANDPLAIVIYRFCIIIFASMSKLTRRAWTLGLKKQLSKSWRDGLFSDRSKLGNPAVEKLKKIRSDIFAHLSHTQFYGLWRFFNPSVSNCEPQFGFVADDVTSASVKQVPLFLLPAPFLVRSQYRTCKQSIRNVN